MRKLLLLALLLGFLSMTVVNSVSSQEPTKPKVPRLTTEDVGGATHSPPVHNGNNTNVMQVSGNGKDDINLITAKLLFKTGTTTIKRINAGLVTDLPVGFTVYNNMAFDVATEAVVSGPHTIVFNVASVQDPEVFAHLRVLSREMNQLDPATTTWFDRTVVAPQKPAPDFSTRTITGRPDDFGQIVVALFDSREAEKMPIADLSVQITCSPDPVIQNRNTTYTFTVRNAGPQPAPDVLFNGIVGPDMKVISMVSSQGDCRESERSDGTVICHIGTLPADKTVMVTVVIYPTPNLSYPKGKQKYPAIAIVASKARESNYTNNHAHFVSK
jgi:uncharacterized repeat protein (TIGR01451 family)